MKIKLVKVAWIFLDISLLTIALIAAFNLRFGFNIPLKYLVNLPMMWLLIILFKTVVLYAFDLQSQIWRHASIKEAKKIIYAASLASLGALFIVYTVNTKIQLPRSIFFIDWMLSVALIGASRFSVRLFEDTQLETPKIKAKIRPRSRNILIIGAGEAGALLVKKMKRHKNLGYKPVAFLDDNPKKQGYFINNVPVLGDRSILEKVIKEYDINEVVIALPTASGEARKDIVFRCNMLNVQCKTTPGIAEIIHGKVEIDRIRNVEVEDILGRDVVKIDLNDISKYLCEKRILITGAAGSIGSELCRQITNLNPASIIALDISEGALYNLKQELKYSTGTPIVYSVCDIKDERTINELFSIYSPQVIFHAAANKHVDLMESHPLVAVSNNLTGTKVVAGAAEKFGSERFVLISTDKAVNPANIMGISKALAEKHLQILQRKRESSTNFSIVRFGNVLGSNGSVVPIFKKQIERRQPITITHPEMTRYFMTITEAVHLVIQAGELSAGKDIFVLDMGTPVSVLDLAYNIIRLSGLEPHKDVAINFIGIRPGEKLREELYNEDEEALETNNSKIHKASLTSLDQALWLKIIAEVENITKSGNADTLITLLTSTFPGYDKSISNRQKKSQVINLEDVRTKNFSNV